MKYALAIFPFLQFSIGQLVCLANNLEVAGRGRDTERRRHWVARLSLAAVPPLTKSNQIVIPNHTRLQGIRTILKQIQRRLA
jgi:hypothetical protein